jgi:ketosteroid isomerase-like protein
MRHRPIELASDQPPKSINPQGEAVVSNAQTVQDIYAAFGQGDIPAILARLADDVDWGYGRIANDVPWLQRRRGSAGAQAFFESLGALEFHNFAPKQIIEGDGIVVSLVDIDFTVKATGKRVTEEDEIHVWRFNADGKVARFKEGLDTLAHQLAYKG